MNFKYHKRPNAPTKQLFVLFFLSWSCLPVFWTKYFVGGRRCVLLKFHAKIKVKTPTYNFEVFFVKSLDHDICTIKTGFINGIHTIYYRHYHKKSKLPINKATDYAGAAKNPSKSRKWIEYAYLNIRDTVNGIASNLKAELLKYSITDRYNCNVHTL